MRRFTILMTLLIVILFAINLVVGAVDIPSWWGQWTSP